MVLHALPLWVKSVGIEERREQTTLANISTPAVGNLHVVQEDHVALLPLQVHCRGSKRSSDSRQIFSANRASVAESGVSGQPVTAIDSNHVLGNLLSQAGYMKEMRLVEEDRRSRCRMTGNSLAYLLGPQD